ncbi:MAG: glyoxalase [Bacteroidia bacterium]|nr:MAG: glyoxalase [Bacteroidia bacterium]
MSRPPSTSTAQIRPNVRQAVPFFLVQDINASIRFYVDGLGFAITHKWIGEGDLRWCWLELGGAALMLQGRRDDGQHGPVPEGKVGIGVAIYFLCDDALAVYRDISSRGVQARRPFVGNRMWVTQVRDPDGYDLFFESPTDEAEETVYSEDA